MYITKHGDNNEKIWINERSSQLCTQHKQLRKESLKKIQAWTLNDQLPVGLIAQWVEHCTGIAEVMDSNPIQAWIFFRLSFHCLSCVYNCDDHSFINCFFRSFFPPPPPPYPPRFPTSFPGLFPTSKGKALGTRLPASHLGFFVPMASRSKSGKRSKPP